MTTTWDAVVIGGGPGGATAAFGLARRGRRVVLVDPLGIGGQLVNVERLPDFPGFPQGVAGWDLAAALGEQALDAGAEVVLGTAVGVHAAGSTRWRVGVDGMASADLEARAVLLATGRAHRALPGAEGLVGQGVSYCASCDGPIFAGRSVAVVGGGDIAFAEAVTLAGMAAHVSILCPDPEPVAAAAWVRAVGDLSNVEVLSGWQVRSIVAESGVVTGIRGGPVTADADEVRTVDGVFGALEGVPNSSLLAGVAGLGAAEPVIVEASMVVSGAVRGIFAAGDVRSGSLASALGACGDGAVAAASIDAYLAAS